MKVGFTGSGGTGKSTVLKAILPKLVEMDPSIEYLPSVARTVFSRHGVVEADQENWSPKELYSFQKEILDLRLEKEREHPNFISDRTMIDHVAYTMFRCYEGIPDDEFASLMALLEENINQYDIIFYFPILFTPPPDGLRQGGEAYRSAIDLIIRGLATSNIRKVPVITLTSINNDAIFDAIHNIYSMKANHDRK